MFSLRSHWPSLVQSRQLVGPVDRTRINVWEPTDLAYWAAYFRVTEAEVEEAVKLVGPRIEDIAMRFES